MNNSEWNDLRARYEKARNEQDLIDGAVLDVTRGVTDAPIFTDGCSAYRFIWDGRHYHAENVGRVDNAKERFAELKKTVRGIKA